MRKPDCDEWAELASAIYNIVLRELDAETALLRKFGEAEDG
jgi:hypothetical protein